MPNAALVNFAAGETSPRSRGRFDAPWYPASCQKLQNWIPEVAGPARYRPAFKYVAQTRGGAVTREIPFQLNDSQAYMLLFSASFMRVVKNGALLTTATTTVTAVSLAAEGVLTVASAASLNNDDEIIITGIVGMEELNGRQIKLSDKSGSTFKMKDVVTGSYINTSAYTAWVSGGSVGKVYEIASPYLVGDLDDIQFTQSNTTMYLTHLHYVPRKLTAIADVFTLATYVRTNDPFANSTAALTITDVRPLFVGDIRRKAAANLTPGATTGAGITFTASAAVFTSADVGKYLRNIEAAGYGYAKIVTYVSPTEVTADISVDFDNTTVIATGSWQVVTVETQITLAANSIVNSTLNYAMAAVAGATQINGNTYLLVPYEASGFSSGQRYILRTTGAGAAVDSTAWGVYSSGGTATPSATQPSLTITGITRASTKTILTFSAGSIINENSVYDFSGVVGTTEINGQSYFLKNVNGEIRLRTYADAEVDSSAWTAYSSGGLATLGQECPIGVAFYESRLWFFGTNQRPNSVFGSRAPDDDGNPRYDDYTGGTDADHACFFALAPVNGQIDFISWGRGTAKYLFVGTFGGPFRISGSGLDEPITPSSINVRQFDSFGCEAVMAAGGSRIFYIQRGGVALRTTRYDSGADETSTYDMLLNAEHIAASRLKRVALQTGRPDVLWVVREDGILAGMTVQGDENVAGWHRQKIGGTSALVLDAQVISRTDRDDQLWVITERVVDSVTRRFVEVLADDVTFPDREDFYGQGADEGADRTLWENAVYRRQEEYVHVDAAGTYDGSDRGSDAAATITLSAATVGTGRTITASVAVFRSGDVGREIWVKPDRDTGVGGGRATITAYTDTTHVTATVTVAFSSVGAHAAGDWYFTATTVYGLWHLEGQSVAVVVDGAVYGDGRGDVGTAVTVSSGKITLTDAAAVVHVGLPYDGVVKTQNLEAGGRAGPAQAKPRNIYEFAIRFLNTLGVQYGTDLYNLETIEHRRNDAFANRPAPVFSGIRKLPYPDRWRGTDNEADEKHIVFAQFLPLPATVQFVDARYELGDD